MQVKENDKVKIHYTGYNEKNAVFETTTGQGAVIIPLGKDYMLPGIEKALIGMSAGEQKTLILPFEEAYGESDPDLIMTVDKSVFPEGVKLRKGVVVMSEAEDGSELPLTIQSVRGNTVTVDANHPMAGKEVKFDIQLIEIL